MATTTSIKLKKNDNLIARCGSGAGSYARTVSGYEYFMRGHPVYVRKDDCNGRWIVCDAASGLGIGMHFDTRREAVDETERIYGDRYERYWRTDDHKKQCRFLGILIETGETLSVRELEKRYEDEQKSYEDKKRDEASGIADSISLIYEWLYSANVYGEKYSEYVRRGEEWALNNPEMVRYITDARGGDPLTSDRELAALTFAITHDSPLHILKDERHD